MPNKRRSNSGRRATKSNQMKKITTPTPKVASTTTTPPAVDNQKPSALLTREQTDENANTPVMKNNEVSNDFEMEDANETVKSSEKPPEHKPTYQSTLLKYDLPMTDLSKMSTFLLHKKVHDDEPSPIINVDDDDTVTHENSSSTKSFPHSVRMTMMFKLPQKKEGCTDDDAPITAIQKMNLMLKSLTNKLPCRVGPWTLINPKLQIKETDLFTTFPEDIDLVESYVYDYNRFISLGKTGYVRLRIFYADSTSPAEIQGIAAQFKKPREQFLELSHSEAISPVNLGTLTGSVKAMSESSEFQDLFKVKFNLSELGMWFTQPRTSRSSDFSKDKFTVHIEIDRSDIHKRDTIEQFFNHSPSGLDNTFLGTPMLLVKAFDYYADDDVKVNIDNHARKQTNIGKSLRCTKVPGIQLCNWSNSDKNSTLLRDLMATESIVEKKVIKGKNTTKFKGRVFYSIVPDRNSYTFYYTKANFHEGRSIARGLPLFIRDHFRLDPAFFCDSDLITSTLEGEWSYKERRFLSANEKLESDKLDLMEIEALAEAPEFISKDQQLAMQLDDDDASKETRLTKGDAPPTAYSDNVSEMTGSTRESKAKAYADKEVRKVAAQYSSTISNMHSDLGDKDDKIAQLQLMIKQMKETGNNDEDDEGISYSTPDKQVLPPTENIEPTEEDSTSRPKKRKSEDPYTDNGSSHEDDMSL